MGNVPPNAQGGAPGGAGQPGGPGGVGTSGAPHQGQGYTTQYGAPSSSSQAQQQQQQQQGQGAPGPGGGQPSPSRGGGGAVSYPAPMVQGSTYNYQQAGAQSQTQSSQAQVQQQLNASQYQPYVNNAGGAQHGSPHHPSASPPKRRSHNDVTMADAHGQEGAGGGPGPNASPSRGDHGAGSGANSGASPGTAPPNAHHAALLAAAEEDTVPTVFRWEHGGRQVYITGTFNDWSRQIPMHRSGNDFTYIHNLRRGKHAFKFIVDDEWRFAPDQPTVADIEGRINNFIDVSDFTPYTGDRYFEERVDGGGVTAAILAAGPPSTDIANADGEERKEGDHITSNGGDGHHSGPHGHHHGHHHDGESPSSPTANNTPTGPTPTLSHQSIMAKHYYAEETKEASEFGQNMPDLDEYTKEPPPLPPHLRHIILNKAPQLSDTSALPVPQHVALNHLYCTAIKDNMMVLGITQRHKTKFATTVYYSPCS